MTEIIGVRFKELGKVYSFDPHGTPVQLGQKVIVETARGIELGEVALANKMVEDSEIVSPLKGLVRVATEEDLRRAEQHRQKEKEAFAICSECIEKHDIDMHLVDAEYTFDGAKLMFYFTSDGRVDFRELLKELARIFRTRIDLRQIGVRDEAKMLGGIGICGRPFCCSSFLEEFQPVSIKMAKEQSLSLNPMKISGACGRLMCCLKYEQAAYEDLTKRVPPVGSLVETPDGRGVVTEATLLRERVKVRLDSAPDQPPAEYQANACKILRKSRGGYDKTENVPD
ncbi:MAG: stage 0 sporulation family protein [Clostridiales bacterium]|nr:stage 0 sporulation family protein [Clostridiales bacterium]MDD7309613.1 stage 0 sporulation family protein [Eubacteriales bacterium]MDY5347123.1 stage 0 sporulation family protein [Eubacteriales bacterium]